MVRWPRPSESISRPKHAAKIYRASCLSPLTFCLSPSVMLLHSLPLPIPSSPFNNVSKKEG